MDSEDNMDEDLVPADIRARRRRLHTEAEQRRRDAIKRGFDHLLELIHPAKCDPGGSLIRMSKATILNKSISMIMKLSRLETQKRLEIETLQKKVQALKILKSSYERVSNANACASESPGSIITMEVKLNLFQLFMEDLFRSFDYAVSEVHLEELSQQVIEWVENNCKPEFLHDIMEQLMKSVVDGECNYSQPFRPQENTSLMCMHQRQQQTNASSPLFNQTMSNSSSNQELVQKSFSPLSDQPKQMYNTHSDMFTPDTYHIDMTNNTLQQQQQQRHPCLHSYSNSNIACRLQQSDSLKPTYPETQHSGFSSSTFYSPLSASTKSLSSACSYHTLNTVSSDVVDPQLQSSDPYSSRFPHPEEGNIGGPRDSGNRPASSLVVNSTLPSNFQAPFQTPTASTSPPHQHNKQQQEDEVVRRQQLLYMQSSHLNHNEHMVCSQKQQQPRERSEMNYLKKDQFFR